MAMDNLLGRRGDNRPAPISRLGNSPQRGGGWGEHHYTKVVDDETAVDLGQDRFYAFVP